MSSVPLSMVHEVCSTALDAANCIERLLSLGLEGLQFWGLDEDEVPAEIAQRVGPQPSWPTIFFADDRPHLVLYGTPNEGLIAVRTASIAPLQ